MVREEECESGCTSMFPSPEVAGGPASPARPGRAGCPGPLQIAVSPRRPVTTFAAELPLRYRGRQFEGNRESRHST